MAATEEEAQIVCECGEPVSMSWQKKDGPNQGRAFWHCSNPDRERQCRFFKWAGPPLNSAPCPQGARCFGNKRAHEAVERFGSAPKVDQTAQTLVDVLASSCSLAQATSEIIGRHEGRFRALLDELQKCIPCLKGSTSSDEGLEAAIADAPKPKRKRLAVPEDEN